MMTRVTTCLAALAAVAAMGMWIDEPPRRPPAAPTTGELQACFALRRGDAPAAARALANGTVRESIARPARDGQPEIAVQNCYEAGA